jgi:predicted permease
MASAEEKPIIPIAGPIMLPLVEDSTNKVPIIGPVHENETKLKVKAMKKIPIKPPLSAFPSALFTHLLGIRISNAPKNEKAKIMKMEKNSKFIQTFVDKSFKPEGPMIAVITNPIVT